MKLFLTASLAFTFAMPAAAFSQTPVAPAIPATAPVKFTLDTPIVQIFNDPKAKVIFVQDIGIDVSDSPMYDDIKTKSLNDLSAMAPDRITPATLEKIKTDLAALK